MTTTNPIVTTKALEEMRSTFLKMMVYSPARELNLKLWEKVLNVASVTPKYGVLVEMAAILGEKNEAVFKGAVARYVCKRLDARIFPDRKLKPFTMEEKKSALKEMADDLFSFTF